MGEEDFVSAFGTYPVIHLAEDAKAQRTQREDKEGRHAGFEVGRTTIQLEKIAQKSRFLAFLAEFGEFWQNRHLISEQLVAVFYSSANCSLLRL